MSVMATAYAPAHMSAALPTRNLARVMTCRGHARDTDTGVRAPPSAFRMRVVFEELSVIDSSALSSFHGPIETRMRKHHSGSPSRSRLAAWPDDGRTIAHD